MANSDDPTKMPYISCFGCPMLDLVAEVTSDFLEHYDLEMDGNIMVDAGNVAVYNDLYVKAVSGVTEVVGGAAQNTARICQWALDSVTACTYSRAGNESDESTRTPSNTSSCHGPDDTKCQDKSVPYRCVSVGCVGRDRHGQALAVGTEADHVQVEYAHHPSLATGVCAVLVSGVHRCLVSNYGAWMDYPGQHLDTIWERVVLQSRIIYMSGFFVQSCNDAARRLANYARKHSILLCTNLSAEYVCRKSHSELIETIQLADVVFGNYSEAAALGEASGGWSARDDVLEMTRKLCSIRHHDGKLCVGEEDTDGQLQHSRTVVLTRGQEPVVVCSKSGKSLTIQEFPVPAVENIIDTNGAGDALVAGYLCGLARDYTQSHCTQLAIACAGRVIQECGCTVPKIPLRL